MEPDYERPNTVAGLVAKRDELAKLRERYRAEVARLTEALAALGTVIALFDPNAEDAELRDAVTADRAKRGAVKAFVLNTLRESAEPMTTRRLSELWAAAQGMPSDPATIGTVRRRIRSCVKAAAAQGVVECVGGTTPAGGGAPAKLWQVAGGTM